MALLLRAWLAGADSGALADHPAYGFPDALRAALPELGARLGAVAAVAESEASDDGSERLLVRLADAMTVESVLLDRRALCVSTQIGCRVGCVFCKTGESGLLRQLTGMEILAQVALARRRRDVTRVVFMGMGEPAHNIDAVLEAMHVLGTDGKLPHKSMTFSTVGSRACFARLTASRVRPALALSLHTTCADKRRELLPRAPAVAPDELVELADGYGALTGHPVQYQWTLIEGVNDDTAEADRLIELLRGKRAIMNYIPYNAIDGYAFRRPDWEHCVALVRRLRRAGIVATLRRSGGQDVSAACGQLRARVDAHLG